MRVWNISAGTMLREVVETPEGYSVTSLAFSLKSPRTVSGLSTGSVWVWDARTVHTSYKNDILEGEKSEGSKAGEKNRGHWRSCYLKINHERRMDQGRRQAVIVDTLPLSRKCSRPSARWHLDG